MRHITALSLMLFIFSGCAMKAPLQSQSATILIKTPAMKFYDKGFINHYDEYINVEIYSAGVSVLKLDIYENQICQSTLECVSSREFNQEFLNKSYEDDFLYKLFLQNKKEVVFRDRPNRVLIKIKRDGLIKN